MILDFVEIEQLISQMTIMETIFNHYFNQFAYSHEKNSFKFISLNYKVKDIIISHLTFALETLIKIKFAFHLLNFSFYQILKILIINSYHLINSCFLHLNFFLIILIFY